MQEVLSGFAAKVNANKRMEGLLNGWDRCIAVKATDTGLTRYINVKNRNLSIASNADAALDGVEIEGAEDLLKDIFSGVKNPAKESLDGNIHVFGSDKDQMKLDAIALVLWGF
jgi:hypothetical protein